MSLEPINAAKSSSLGIVIGLNGVILALPIRNYTCICCKECSIKRKYATAAYAVFDASTNMCSCMNWRLKGIVKHCQ